jgi:hypothetical protein
MTNAVAGCLDYGTVAGRYCINDYSANAKTTAPTLLARLSATTIAHKAIKTEAGWSGDSIFATKTYPAWSWRSAYYASNVEYKKAFTLIPNNDYYGLSILPTGYRSESAQFIINGKHFLLWLAGNRVYAYNESTNAIWTVSNGNVTRGGNVRCIRSQP